MFAMSYSFPNETVSFSGLVGCGSAVVYDRGLGEA